MLFWENKIPFIFKKFWKIIILIFGSIVTILGVMVKAIISDVSGEEGYANAWPDA